LEIQREQKACDDLGARVDDAEILRGGVPIAVKALSGRFVSTVGKVRIRFLCPEQMLTLVRKAMRVSTTCSWGL
jgi:hypothetical protein